MAVNFFPMPIRRIVVGVLALFLSCGCDPLQAQDTRFEFAQVHMGMEVRVILFAGESTLARAAAAAAFDRILKLEDTMSDYRDESEVRRLAHRSGEWVAVSADLYAVLAEAWTLAERSEGAFDPTVGPIVRLWREARRTGRLPAPDALRAARERVGWRLVQLDAARSAVRLERPGLSLDLGGIAKGYILDRALEAARASGVSRALLIAGGDIVAGDAPPGLTGWNVETTGAGPEIRARAGALVNAALSTSGDGEQFVVIDGVRYSHVVDPRSGRPLTDGCRAYVIAQSGMIADGLATALTVVDSISRGRLLGYYPDAFVETRRFRADSNSTPGSRPSQSDPSSDRYPPR
jgi:thiamine biosynthesis lipoprotein